MTPETERDPGFDTPPERGRGEKVRRSRRCRGNRATRNRVPQGAQQQETARLKHGPGVVVRPGIPGLWIIDVQRDVKALDLFRQTTLGGHDACMK